MDFDSFKGSAIRTSRLEGFTSTQPVSWMLLGPSIDNRSTVQRRIHVSAVAPPLYDGTTTELWFDPVEYKVYKSSNWINPVGPTWKEVASYNEMFFDVQDLASALPPDIASKTYVNEVLSNLQSSGTIIPVLAPVQNTTALRAVAVATVPDKQTIFVEDANQFYAYDFQSVAPEDAYTVRPASGVGRWILTGPSNLDSGAF